MTAKQREYERLLTLARGRFKSVQQQNGDFRGGAWISPDGRNLLINRALPLDDRIELMRKLLDSQQPTQPPDGVVDET